METELPIRNTSRDRLSASRVWWVTGLALLSGSGWLLTEAYPSEVGSPFAGCIHFAVIGLAGLLGGRCKVWTRGRLWAIAGAGSGVFVLPGLVARLTVGMVSESATVAVFCSVPLMIVLCLAWLGEGSERRLMMPGLVGLFGALLVFSVELPRSLRSGSGLAAVIACAAVVAGTSVSMFRLMRGMKIASAVAVVGFAGAMVLGGYGLGVGWPTMTLRGVMVEAMRCVVFDLPVVWLTMWLMREIPPERLAARFLIAPVVTWLEGYAIVRGSVEVRSVVALVLMAAGAVMLLLLDESNEVLGLRLR